MNSLIILYELGHVDKLLNFLNSESKEDKKYLIIALSLDIEKRLLEKNINYISARVYKFLFVDQLSAEDKMLDTFFADSRWKDLNYRNINFTTTFEFMFRSYFQRVRYYANILISIFETHKDILRVITFSSAERVSKTHGILAKKEIHIVFDCLKLITDKKGLPLVDLSVQISVNNLINSVKNITFSLKREIFSFLLMIWNGGITIIRSPQFPRLIISDYWRNVGPTIKSLEEGECIFLDRSEIRNINWRYLFKYRMRFVHVHKFVTKKAYKDIKIHAYNFKLLWNDICRDLPIIFLWRGYDFGPLLYDAFNDIVDNFDKILSEIEGTYSLYKKYKPDLVNLRASVSAQTHFSILSLVARECNIPSLELQHGLEYLGPGSCSRKHVAEYIAVYGPLIKRELISMGYNPDKIKEIGSPRFDNYYLLSSKTIEDHTEDHNREKINILCIAPDLLPFEIYDSYSAEDYFKAIKEAIKDIPNKNLHLTFKLRPVSVGEDIMSFIIKNIFSDISYTINHYENIVDLCLSSDIIISGFSTVILEALQFAKPIIIPALNPIDKQMVSSHFSPYEKAGALFIVFNIEVFNKILLDLVNSSERRREASKLARKYMNENFMFDGKSSERYIKLIIDICNKNFEYEK